MGKYEAPRQKRARRGAKRFLFGLLLILVTFSILLAVFGKMDQSKSGFQKILSVFSFSPKEIKKEALGIDVARYQGTIDWAQVAESDVDFAMIRLGYRTQVEGDIIEDSNARYNLQEAARNDIHLGAYFFSSAITPEEAREEAAWVADLVAKYPITYPIAYNCEGFLENGNRNSGMSPRERTDIALAFLEAIEDYGYEGMFYASKNEMEEDAQWIASELQKSYKIWVAQYPDQPYPETEESSYSGKHKMWQYTTIGNVPGVPVNVDCDLSYFSYNKPKPPKDSEEPVEVQPDPEALMPFDAVQETVTAKEETNLRSLPSQGPESVVLHTLHHGELAERIGISSSGWSKVSYNGNIYYAVSNFLTTDLNGKPGQSDEDGDGIQTVFQDVEDEEVTPKDTVNLRSLPSVKDPDVRVVAQLKNGDIAIRTGISSNGWSRLKYQDMTCYAITSYLVGPDGPEDTSDGTDIQTKFQPTDEKVTPKDAVNLRTRPTVEKDGSEVRIKLKHGQIVKRTGINEDLGWSRVEYEGEVLYCVSRFLESAEPSKKP